LPIFFSSKLFAESKLQLKTQINLLSYIKHLFLFQKTMKNKKIILFLAAFTLFGGVAFGFGELRGIPNIVTREDRWADESRRYSEQTRYQSILDYQELQKKELAELKETDIEAYLEEKKTKYKMQLANEYLMDNFGKEYEIDYTNKYHEWNELRQTESFSQNKTKFIIHHTADEFSWKDTKDEILDYMQNTYKFHAFKRGWGDIWYNFIIDPNWDIYEWRAWWRWVIGTHTAWNNSPAIGIALMGNFEIEEPTEEQIKSLINLITRLAKDYWIDPNSKVYYHRKSNDAPYLESNENYTIAWHTDAGYTACPWKNLYNKLPEIRKEVRKNLKNTQLIKSTASKIHVPGFFYSNLDTVTLETNVFFGKKLDSCLSKDTNLKVISCVLEDDVLKMQIKKSSGFASWPRSFKIKWGEEVKEITLTLLRQDDMKGFVQRTQDKYTKTHSLPQATSTMQKMTHKVTLKEAKQLNQQKINVLLNELSRDYDTWHIVCPSTCSFVADEKVFVENQAILAKKDNKLILSIGWEVVHPTSVFVSSEDNLITIANYTRTSYTGIPRNSFRGMLSFVEDHIGEGENITQQYIVINTLDFKDYLKGVVESNDTEHLEKNKVMALVAKSYALFYMHPENRHPSIPLQANYNAIDDPDLFQKYVGAGLEKTLTKRYQALNATANEIPIYKWYIPILPYFHCSPWFTHKASNKRGWIDTPYLEQVTFDVSKCSDFEWHGVGMSGKGAERRAKMWFTYSQLLNYYYPGVRIGNL